MEANAKSLPAGPPGGGRHRRSIKNFLIDPAFQLKYTSYLVVVALLLSVVLGALIWKTGDRVINESRKNTAQSQETVAMGLKLVEERENLSKVVRMNVVKTAGGDPDLEKLFDKKDAEEQAVLVAETKKLKDKQAELSKQAIQIEKDQKMLRISLVIALSVMVALIGAAGIVITHKVAGPIYKMKRQMKDLAEGQMHMPHRLRKGDELVHFFETFEDTVRSLRERQAAEIKKLEEAIAGLEQANQGAVSVSELRVLRDEMQSALDS
jgi:methyl-accepting chemotaxis protein